MNLESLVSEKLSTKRYEHTLRVANTARILASIYGVDEDKGYRAGLLHDYAKELPLEQLLQIAEDHGWQVDEIERRNPYLLHGPVAAICLKLENIETDEDVLSAIASHTTGHAQMTDLEKIIYVADMLEPGRKNPELVSLRANANKGLDFITFLCVQHSLEWLVSDRRMVHHKSVELYNSLLEEH